MSRVARIAAAFSFIFIVLAGLHEAAGWGGWMAWIAKIRARAHLYMSESWNGTSLLPAGEKSLDEDDDSMSQLSLDNYNNQTVVNNEKTSNGASSLHQSHLLANASAKQDAENNERTPNGIGSLHQSHLFANASASAFPDLKDFKNMVRAKLPVRQLPVKPQRCKRVPCITGRQLGRKKQLKPMCDLPGDLCPFQETYGHHRDANVRCRNNKTVPFKKLIFYTCRGGNINHGFHQNFWPAYTTLLAHQGEDFAVLFFAATCRRMQQEVFWELAHYHKWHVYVAPADTRGVRICAREEIVIAQDCPKPNKCLSPKGLLRPLKAFLQVAFATRYAKYWDQWSRTSSQGLRPLVAIYDRREVDRRHLNDAKRLIRLFDTRSFDVQIVQIPTPVEEQVRLFSSLSMLLTPHGGWLPNLLWMRMEGSCVVELHGPRNYGDDWINWGLGSTIGEYHVLIGDWRKGRHLSKGPQLKGRDTLDPVNQDYVASNYMMKRIQDAVSKGTICKQYFVPTSLSKR